MQAAFVDIGLQKDAFLYAGDYTTNLADLTGVMLAVADDEGEGDEADADPDADVVGEVVPRREMAPIEDLVHKDQTVLVQVSKESLGTKGARITSFISLPGRYLVYMPQARHIGVSRRIRDDRERERLRAALRSVSLPPGGFILRTNAEGKSESEFAADVEFFTRLWAQVQARFEQAPAPAVLHEEGDLTFRVVRDLFSPEVDEFVVDSREVYDKCAGYVEALVTELREQVYRALKRALAEDKARTNVLEISELGLVEMTRKRVRQDLRSLLSVVCPTCKGSGITKSDATLAAEIFRGVQAKVATAEDANGREVVIRVHPDLARYFEGDGHEGLERLARVVERKITIQPNHADREGYEVRLRGGASQ